MSLLPEDPTPTRPGVARRNTGEWETVTTGEYRNAVVRGITEPRGVNPLAVVGVVCTAIGVFVAAVGMSLNIGDRLYYKATDGAALAADVRATLATVKEIQANLQKDKP
jgi:hypothetical protein